MRILLSFLNGIAELGSRFTIILGFLRQSISSSNYINQLYNTKANEIHNSNKCEKKYENSYYHLAEHLRGEHLRGQAFIIELFPKHPHH
jgi:hypothetical protein